MAATTPKTLKFDLVNVFLADKKTYSGNPLGVFYEGHDLEHEQCLSLARQFNLSEITFPSHVSTTEKQYSMRIYTTGGAVPFAGHPSCGTAFALLHSAFGPGTRAVTQHTLSGPTQIAYPDQVGSPYEPARVSIRAIARPASQRLDYKPDVLAPVLGLDTTQRSSVKFVRRASCGLPWQYACIDSYDVVENAKVSSDKLEAWSAALRDSLPESEKKEGWIHGLVAFVPGEVKDGELQIRARVFFSEGGVLTEDSATGSAALGLGLVLHEEGLLKAGVEANNKDLYTYAVLQGVEMKQPSQLFGRVELDEGSKAVAVHVAGDVVKVGSGEVVVPYT